MSAERFARELRAAEDRLRAFGYSGRSAYAALCRHLARRLGLPHELWLDGPDPPAEAGLDRIPLTAELDLFGLAYERFFPEVFKGERGQFFTPRPLVELMVDLAGVRPGDRVVDPACGSGSFLVSALLRGADVDGTEVDPELVALCRLNLKLHGANPRAVVQADLFRDEPRDEWDVVLANPPFSVPIDDPAALRRFSLARGKRRVESDTLFVEAAWQRLRPGGRMVVVLPYSVLANPKHAELRQFIDQHFVRHAIVSLPEGTFRPFGGSTSRACVLSLHKRPAAVHRCAVAVVREPGYDPTRRTYHPTPNDDLARLRLEWRAGAWPSFPLAAHIPWLPETLLADDGIADNVPTVTLGELAHPDRSSFQPAAEPDAAFTEIDLADVDKGTGEVTAARARRGSEFRGAKKAFAEGDILFARMRPELNNVVIARRPDPELPERLCGSSEWVRLQPFDQPHFVLIAARSEFVRAQLRATAGQTRPRLRPSDLPKVRVPDPGPEARALIDAVVAEAHAIRLAARRRLDRVAALYEAFGRGEIDEATLTAELKALTAS